MHASRSEAVASLRKEARTLEALSSHELGFSTPRFVCLTGRSGSDPTGLVESALSGGPLEWLRKSASHQFFLIEKLAEIAAAIHRLPVHDFGFLPHHVDSRDHLAARLDDVSPDFRRDDHDAVIVDAWLRDHLPRDRPACLLHGDLLPQNVLWDSERNHLSVIDWEYASIGDPAYNLAIVSRGTAKLFGQADGLRRFVDAYHRAGGAAVNVGDVVNHELLLVLSWLWDAVQAEQAGRRDGHPPEHWRQRIRAILRRAGARPPG